MSCRGRTSRTIVPPTRAGSSGAIVPSAGARSSGVGGTWGTGSDRGCGCSSSSCSGSCGGLITIVPSARAGSGGVRDTGLIPHAWLPSWVNGN